MTNEEAQEEIRYLRKRNEALREEVQSLEEELSHEQKLTAELHHTIDRLSRKAGPDATALARAVHEFFYKQDLVPGLPHWKVASTHWRQLLEHLVEPYSDNDAGC